MKTKILWTTMALVLLVAAALQGQPGRENRQRAALQEPFLGVTTDGTSRTGLFHLATTGVSTDEVRRTAAEFLQGLSEEQRQKTVFSVDSTEWRDWHNVHRARREGVSFGEMNQDQRQLAFELLAASLSAKGLDKTRNVMLLNEHLAELVDKHGEYGDEFYYLTVMGEPSGTEPWGWQLDGHHLVINYFVLGDQVVMSPSFMGSEPVIGSGSFEGVEVMQDEQNKGLALMEALAEKQRAKAMLPEAKSRGNALAQAFNDNLVVDYGGVRGSDLDAKQRELLLEVIREYVLNLADAHAKIRMAEIERYLDETYFAWIGDVGPESVFYYRIHSPVILIEFDHQGPIALGGPRVASRRHIHSVVRTPNGNDYGKDLLRQHYEKYRDDPAHGHVHDN